MSSDARNLFATSGDLACFSRDEISALMSAGSTRTCQPGEVIVERGEAGDSMFVIVEGEVEVDLGEDRAPKVLGAGHFFGELGFIDPSHRRSGTVVSRGVTRLFVLGQEVADTLMERDSRAFLGLIRRTCAALVNSEERLIAELRQKNQELERTLDFLVRTREELSQQELLAQTDELTGLYNRRCFQEQLGRFLGRLRPGRAEGLAIVMIDLDNFKPVNDRLGHAAGDVVLKQVARVLRGAVRRSDLPCRMGGDEFAVLLPDVTEQAARSRAEEVRAAIGELPPVDPEVDLPVTASMGGTMYRAGEPPEEFVRRADEVLYAAKEAGRNQVVWAGVRGS